MSEVTSQVELHDSDILRVEGVIAKLNEKSGTWTDMEKFRQEIIGRFQDIGLSVTTRVYTTNVEGCIAFDVDIDRRLEGEFDPDRQVHEVTNDLLDLGEGGVIKSADVLKMSEHQHGHGGHSHH